ncbi:setd7 [Symbiodinium sp. CCMP2592]|nr:setd7 [Symbiodinium sp. CCMP2592]
MAPQKRPAARERSAPAGKKPASRLRRPASSSLDYTGDTDEAGNPHGRGILKMKGAVYEGEFEHGLQSGQGLLRFADGSTCKGGFAAGQPHGRCEYYDPDDRTTMVGSYVAGQLHGRAVQLDEAGLLVFRGAFEKDVRAGMAQVFDDFGGCVVGAVDAEGEHSGDDILYVFPDGLTALVGSFNDGVFVRGRYARLQAPLVRPARESDLEDLLSADVDFPAFALVKEIRDFVHRGVSTRETLCAQPLIPDLFELERVTVSQSGLKEDMEGLFAKRPLRAGELCSWYNGLRCSHEAREVCINGCFPGLLGPQGQSPEAQQRQVRRLRPPPVWSHQGHTRCERHR